MESTSLRNSWAQIVIGDFFFSLPHALSFIYKKFLLSLALNRKDLDDKQLELFTCEPAFVKNRLHRRCLSQQLNATQCNFCRAEVATSCDFIAILVQFVSVNVSIRLLLNQKLCAC